MYYFQYINRKKTNFFEKISFAACNVKRKLLALGNQEGKIEIYTLNESNKIYYKYCFFLTKEEARECISNLCFNDDGTLLAVSSKNQRNNNTLSLFKLFFK